MKVEIELKGVKEALEMFDPKIVIQAGRTAINRTAQSARTHASKKIREEYNIKAGRLKDYLVVSARAKKDDLSAVITGKGRGLALSYFDARQEGQRILSTGKGKSRTSTLVRRGRRSPGAVSVLVKKTGGRKIVSGNPRPFLAQMKSGHIGVFARTGKEKFPIRELYGPGVGGLFGSKRIMEGTRAVVQERFVKEFNHQLTYYLARAR